MNINDLKDDIKVQFIDSFIEDVGRTDSYKIMSSFKCERVPALERFISKDYNGRIKPYIVWDIKNQMIIGYFTLITTCLISKPYENTAPEHTQEKDVEKIIPCIELEHFALNDIYLKWLGDNDYNNKKVGNFIFTEYIANIVIILSSEINFTYLTLHAYNDPKVIEAYRKMGFETIEDDAESIIPTMKDVRALHCDYAGDCKFMFQDVETILNNFYVRRNDYV